MTLYDLTAEHQALADKCGAGELDEADLAAIEANEEALRSKAAGYVAVWRSLDCEAEAMEAEARRLSEAARHRKNAAERLRQRLAYCLDTAGIDRLPTPLGTLRVQAASRPRFEVLDLDALPDHLKKVETTVKPIDAALLAAWKAGWLPACVRAPITRSLRVS